MNTSPLVSIITPCYNGEKYMSYFFDSCLAQTYREVEFFFINNASTDRSEEIFMSYKPKLEQKGWRVYYHACHPNCGPAGAINLGLKNFTGKYLTCPDSDDILYPDYLEKKVAFMEQNPDCNVLFSRVDVSPETDRQTKTGVIGRRQASCSSASVFDDIVWGHDLIYAGCSHFTRSSAFLQCYPVRRIYDASNYGQNWQLLLPLATLPGRFVFMDDVLSCYIERASSISHDRNKQLTCLYEWEKILSQVLSGLPLPEAKKKKYLSKIKRVYLLKRLRFRLKTLFINIFGERAFRAVKACIKK